jgi:Ca2+-binding RTX toxin-like protein
MSDLIGTDRNDSLYGSVGSDTFEGGKGNDYLSGGLGNDKYIFNLGDGQDTISDIDKTAGNIDTIVFGENIASTDLLFSRVGNNLKIAIANTNDSITILNYYTSWCKIEQLQFSDGTIWDENTIDSQPMYISGQGTITGTDIDEIIVGSTGKDIIDAKGGNDIIDGRGGGDVINGGTGNDTYIFNSGYGVLTITDYDEAIGNIDTIKFGAGISPDKLVFNKVGLNLEITVSGTTDKIVVTNYYQSDRNRIEQINFNGSVIWNKSDIDAQPVYINGSGELYGTAGVDIMTGGSGNDKLFGYEGNDILNGSGGNDYLYGGTGSDTYIFNQGSGIDTIEDYDAALTDVDTIQFGQGIAPENVIFNKVGADLEITLPGGKDKLIIKNYYSSDFYKFDQIKFSDGTVWDKEDIDARPVYISGSGILNGTKGTDIFTGSADADKLLGYEGNDTFDGKGGNDLAVGGAGNDTYIFNPGYGILTIEDSDGTAGNIDTIQFGAGIDPQGIVFVKIGDNLEITVKGTSDKIVISDFYKDSSNQIEAIKFSGGTVWDVEKIRNQPVVINGTVNDDVIFGHEGNDILSGFSGDDQLIGDLGNDVLDGGAGIDFLEGGEGSDTYIFKKGNGEDIIIDFDSAGGSLDTVKFAQGIAPTDLILQRNSDDLIVIVKGTEDKLTIMNYFMDEAFRIEKFIFENNGTVLDYDQVMIIIGGGDGNVIGTYTGTDGDDTLIGTDKSDIFDGGNGTDYLSGGKGNDTYIFNLGSGVKIIEDNDDTPGNVDTIKFGEGIFPEDIVFVHTGNDLEITINGSSDKIIIKNYFDVNLDINIKNEIEIFEFSNGVVWDQGKIESQPIHTIGTDGDDILTGTGRSDIIDGKLGNDTLIGGKGNDTYIFNPGAGTKIIEDTDDTEGNKDTIKFGSGIVPENIIFAKNQNDLEIIIKDSPDKLIIKNYFVTDYDINISNRIEEIQFSNGVVWNPADISSQLIYILGTNGDDTLYGTDKNDTFDGGKGNDYFSGGKGNDTYIINLGTGTKIVEDNDNTEGNKDTVKFGTGILPENVIFARNQNNLEIIIKGSQDKLIIKNYFAIDYDVNISNRIEEIQFANGVVWNTENISSQTIYTLGTDGNDILYGTDKNDIFDGGNGTDYFSGGKGNDTYIINPGSGIKIIEDNDNTAGNIDTIRFGTGISPEDIMFSHTGSDLEIIIKGSEDKVIIKNYFDANSQININNRIETIVFQGGIVWDQEKIESQLIYTIGTDGDDVLTGTDKSDIFDGLKGNDYFSGGKGNDTYVFDLGTGTKIIEDNDNTEGNKDTIKFGPGIIPENIIFAKNQNNLEIIIKDSPDKVIIKNYFITDYDVNISNRIEEIQFSNGVVWDSAGIAGQLIYIMGTDDDDTLYGTDKNDNFDGGRGTDYFSGGKGNDTYIFNPGTGIKIIEDNDDTEGNIDTIKFGTGISPENIIFSHAGSDLEIIIRGSEDKVIIKNYFDANSQININNRIETIVFQGGVVWNQEKIESQLIYTIGTDGDDVLTGTDKNDIFDGLKGNDYFNGGKGNDTYIFNLGTGSKIIEDIDDTAGNLDTITFGDGILPENIVFARNGYNLEIVIRGSQDKVIIKDYFDINLNVKESSKIEKIVFSNGVVWDDKVIPAQSIYTMGTDGDDVLNGTDKADLFDGLSGKDIFIGGKGNDTYILNPGTGSKTIEDMDDTEGNIDTIKFGPGILSKDILLSRNGSNLEIVIDNSDDRIIVKNYFLVNYERNTKNLIEKFVFSDGEVWGKEKIETQTIYTIGTSGNDVLRGTDVNDIFIGLSGNDNFIGGKGNDTYIYNLGSGVKTIEDTDDTQGNIDTVQFGEGIPPENIVFFRVNDNLEISIRDTGDKLIIKNYFENGSDISKTNKFEIISFSNGTVWDENTILNQYVYSTGSDSIIGTVMNDIITGSAGNEDVYGYSGDDIIGTLGGQDAIYAGDGNDTLDGGAGEDNLFGVDGNDTYIFKRGYGQDFIYESDRYGNSVDTISLGFGITAADVNIQRVNDNLQIAIANTEDVLTVVDYFSDAGSKIEEIRFANGTVWSQSDIEGLTGNADPSLTAFTAGTDGNDILTGTLGNDTLDGGSGSDSLYGGRGDDTYIFNIGYGKDKISDVDTTAGNIDTIKLGEGISEDNVKISKVGNDLILKVNGNDSDELKVINYFLENRYQVEHVEFSNGAVWNQERITAELVYPTNEEQSDYIGEKTYIIGTSGDDTLIPNNQDGDNFIDPLQGNDVMYGGKGNDTYIFGPGYGNDKIVDYDSTPGNVDTVRFINGLARQDLAFSKSQDDLLINIIGSKDTLTISHFFDPSNAYEVEELKFGDGTVLEGVNQFRKELEDEFLKALAVVVVVRRDPVVLDLDGNGIEITTLENGVNFDLDNNGFKEKIQWVNNIDGILARDLNGNGKIDNGSEVFGDQVKMSNGQISANGYEALLDLDKNKDYILDSRDAAFRTLKLWVDENTNGITDTGELKTLTEMGIDSLNLFKSVQDDSTPGVVKQKIGSYQDEEGNVFDMSQFFFNVDLADTIDQEQLIGVDDKVSEILRSLPEIRSVGNVYGLRKSMANNELLRNLVAEFTQNKLINKQDLLDQIVFNWTGTLNVARDGSRGNMDARDLAVVEKFVARKFISNGGVAVEQAAVHLRACYNIIKDYIFRCLATESYLKEYVTAVECKFNETSMKMEFNFDGLKQKCLTKINDADFGFVLSDLLVCYSKDPDGYQGMRKLVDELRPLNEQAYIIATANKVYGRADSESLVGSSAVDYMYGGKGNDQLTGYAGDDYLNGEEGNDALYGGDGTDILVGGSGNDTLDGGNGSDTYIFGIGSGNDTINNNDANQASIDVIKLGTGITMDKLSIRRAMNDLEISVNGTTDVITVKNYYVHDNYKVDKILLEDGSFLDNDAIRNLPLIGTEGDDPITASDYKETIYGLGGNDTINALAGDDIIYGGKGNDTIYAGDGNDYIDGQEGDDTLSGGAGNDTYIFRSGAGKDTIIDRDATSGNFDTLKFEAGISKDNVDYRRVNRDLIITVIGSADAITIKNYYLPEGKIEKIEFADGTVEDNDKLAKLVIYGTINGDSLSTDDVSEVIKGLEGADTIYALGGNDLINGDAGNDFIDAGTGDDTVWGDDGDDQIFGQDGKDLINGNAGNDVIDAGTGDDTVWGDDGDDQIYGQAGNDTIIGGIGNDQIYGGLDNDIIDGAEGNDFVDGGDGNDTYLFRLGSGEDTINDTDKAAASIDTLKFEEGINYDNVSLRRVNRDLVITVNGTSDKVIIKNQFLPDYKIEVIQFGDGKILDNSILDKLVIYGTEGNDGIITDDVDEVIDGLGGSDVINSKGGNDTVNGGTGDDNIVGGTGNDTIYGDAGKDTIDGQDGNDSIYGGADDDTLTGGTGDDILYGNDGADTINGQGGNDTIDGGAGGDILTGDTGNDTYIFGFGSGADKITDLDNNAGNIDTILLGEGIDDNNLKYRRDFNNLEISIEGISDKITIQNYYVNDNYKIEKIQFNDGHTLDNDMLRHLPLYGTENDDHINATDNEEKIYGLGGNDTIYANAGDDYIEGGAGNDIINGGDGNDTIIGQDGNDTLSGEAGNDTLTGGLGNDNLNGGQGNDTYIFERGYGQDRISDVDSTQGNIDTILFAEGISEADMDTRRVLNDLVISINGTEDKLTITDYYQDAGHLIESIRFADGTALDNNKLAGLDVYGTTGADTITATDRNETIRALAGNDVIRANGGDDMIFADAGDDSINAGDGNDSLDGGDGNDTLQGGNGDDILIGGTGNDTLDGGAGNDTYRFASGFGQDTINGTVTNAQEVDTIEFLEGISKENLVITRVINDLIITIKDTDDKLTVRDQFAGNSKIDKIELIDGSIIDSEFINSLPMYGTEGNDTLSGGAGNDTIYGLGGNDTISGNDGGDSIYGGEGADKLYGGTGSDSLYGGAGADTLDGGAGSDLLVGDMGNDTYVFGIGSGEDTITDNDSTVGNSDVIRLGTGITKDNLKYSRVNKDLVLTILGTADKLTIQNYFIDSNKIENILLSDGTAVEISNDLTIYGTEGDDEFQGGGSNETYIALGGNDKISGGDGEDKLYGGDGEDLLDGGSGKDYLEGGTGNDVYIFGIGYGEDTITDSDTTEGNIDTLKFGEGISKEDITMIRSGYNLEITIKGQSDKLTIEGYYSNESNRIEQFMLNDGTLIDSEEADSIVLYGTDNDDTITGGDVAETIMALAGNDTVYGEGGNDIIDGGAGNDTIYGGKGNDTYIFNLGSGVDTIKENDDTYGNTDIIKLGQGISGDGIEFARIGNTLEITVKGASDKLVITDYFSDNSKKIEKIELADGTLIDAARYDNLPLYGTDGDDYLEAGNCKDTIMALDGGDEVFGLSGNDTIYAAGGNDNLHGGAGNDILYGETGDDILNGDSGNDTLVGGAGNDTYKFELGSGVDTIDDYNSTGKNIDTIEFGEHIDSTGVSFVRVGNDLQIIVLGTNDRLNIKNYYVNDDYKIEAIKFNDGTVWDSKAIASQIESRDTKVGTTAPDTISGGTSPDIIIGDSGNDILNGNGGDDILYGGADDDTLNGGDGNDTLTGDEGNDVLNGGIGNDTYVFKRGFGMDTITDRDTAAGNVDTIKFIEGITKDDIEIIRRGNNLEITLKGTADVIKISQAAVAASNRIERIAFDDGTVININDLNNIPVYGTSGDDTLNGDINNNIIKSLEGSDTVSAGDGDDTIYGGSDVDYLYGEAGLDTLYGETGNDFLYGGEENDILYGGEDDDNLDGAEGDDRLYGDSGSDYIEGGDGNDYIEGGDGNDNLIDSSGNDVFNGGAGNDSLSGSIGNDTYIFDKGYGQDTINDYDETEGNIDTIRFGENISREDLSYRRVINSLEFTVNSSGDKLTIEDYFLTSNAVEILQLADNSIFNNSDFENLDIYGTDVKETIIGDTKDNVIYGLAGMDEIRGGAGNDTLRGGDDSDFIYGEDGNDTIYGDSGSDKLNGGAGNDTYVFGTGGGSDIIYNTGSLDTDTDTLLFNDVDYSDITMTKNNTDLLMTINGTGDSITVSGYFNGGEYSLENIEFKNGQILTFDDVQNEMPGTDTLNAATADAAANEISVTFTNEITNDEAASAVPGTDISNAVTTDDATNVITIGSASDLTAAESVMANNEVDQLIQAMAGFTDDSGMLLNQSVQEKPQEAQDILSQFWVRQ